MSRRGVKRTLAGTPKHLSHTTILLNQLHALCEPHCVPWVLHNSHATCVFKPQTAVFSYSDLKQTTDGMAIGEIVEKSLIQAGLTEGRSFQKLSTPDSVTYRVPLTNRTDL
jgi:hypothetical protein